MAKAIKQFDKSNLQVLRVEMDKALQAISNKYGITIKAGNASFSGNECTFKVKLNTKGSDGTVITKEAKSWDLYKGLANGPLDGLNHLNIGDTIHIKGHTTDFNVEIESMQVAHEPVDSVKKGDNIGVKVAHKTRRHDKVFKLVD